jgi:hypothetical protein
MRQSLSEAFQVIDLLTFRGGVRFRTKTGEFFMTNPLHPIRADAILDKSPEMGI